MKKAYLLCLSICLLSSLVHAYTLDKTIWKVNEYPFDYYYGFKDFKFHLRYDGDEWWQWNKGFPFPFGLSLFFDCISAKSFGFAYGEADDMYHYQHIIFNNKEETAISWCYRLIKHPKPGENCFISYTLTLFKIYDDWDGISPPPDE